jgi:hypothetical protein
VQEQRGGTVRNARQCLVSSAPITISEPAVLTATDACQYNVQPYNDNHSYGCWWNGGYLYNFNGLATSIHYLLIIQLPNHSKLVAKGCRNATSCNYASINATYGYDFVAHTIYCAPASSTTSTVATDGVAPLAYAILSPTSATGNTSSSEVFTTWHQAIICSK